ncbi:MAG: tol-pal system protein YbgF [Mesorhizobium sp.]|nr:tol-pal system protein YbgF [Mesorhizobium sp.]MCO5162101.1 tol-pal system protein YbgF [Mesorhizobium sp.]
MKFLSLVLGALALPLAAAPAEAAGDRAPAAEIVDDSPFEVFPLGFSALSSAIAGEVSDEPVYQVAQAADPRIVGLEEQIRQLNGRVEEMNFQILQMQEQMRKMQEDVDFRLQELEQRRSDAGGATPSAEPRTSVAEVQDGALPPPSTPAPSVAQAPAQGPGEPEKPLGSIVFDKDGNVIGGTLDPAAVKEAGAGDEAQADTDGETVAAVSPSASDPQELYRNSYEAILSGDYGTAEAGFRQHITSFPDDPQTADARFWLGESLLGQSRYRDAAEVFVDANRSFPNARKSPDMLLKLGVSLSALNQREVACATFAKINQRYPKSSDSFKERVKQERALAGC